MCAFLGILQLASESLNASAGSAGSLPQRIPPEYGLAVYLALERVAPLPFIEQTLARAEFERGNLSAARRYAARLGAQSERDEWLGRIALARGDRVAASAYFFAAPDIPWLDAEAAGMARTDPADAYAFERRVRDRTALLRMHPDAVAESDWLMGAYAIASARRLHPADSRYRAWLLRSAASDSAAARLAPFNVKYLLSLAETERDLGDVRAARGWYARALAVDPSDAAAARALRGLSPR